MTKEKITISVDERLLEIIDRQRGDTKRSTYINTVLEEYFQPRSPEEKGGGTFVTTLELRKTLKGIHDRLSNLEALDSIVKDIEGLVYESLYGIKDAKRVHLKKKGIAVVPGNLHHEEGIYQKIGGWIDKKLKDRGGIVIDRDFKEYLDIEGVEKTVVGFTRSLRRYGLEYDEKKKQWI